MTRIVLYSPTAQIFFPKEGCLITPFQSFLGFEGERSERLLLHRSRRKVVRSLR